ncbi:MAG: hypothetical protein PHU06_06725 [Gallionella sp.]|nr:hypothetical protein [Gallionella sp.]MDD4958046.1 hypothetical protein [Gallionella sp.]
MTTVKLKLTLPDHLRRRAAQALLLGAARASDKGSVPLSMKDIQAEVHAVRDRAQIPRLTR